MIRPIQLAAALAWLAATTLPLSTPAIAGQAAPAAQPESKAQANPVTLPASRRIDFTSTVNGRRYTAFIALPLSTQPPPTKGYPVLYVLDGNTLFGTAVDAARSFVKSGVVVVGIGYPLDDPAATGATARLPVTNPAEQLRAANIAAELWRDHDLTLPASDDFIKRRPGFGITRDNVGGLDDFLSMIERDLKPKVEALVPIDRANQALFGHSFGGLAVVRAMFTQPSAYRAFIAASPSVYWNDGAVLAGEADFVAKVRSKSVAPRVLITVGGDESNVPPGASASAIDGIRLRRTVDNARDLAARLGSVSGGPGYRVAGVVFADESHVSVQQAAISRGVRFAFAE